MQLVKWYGLIKGGFCGSIVREFSDPTCLAQLGVQATGAQWWAISYHDLRIAFYYLSCEVQRPR